MLIKKGKGVGKDTDKKGVAIVDSPAEKQKKDCVRNHDAIGAVEILTSEKFGQVRRMWIDGEMIFVGKDVCLSLGHKNYSTALARLSPKFKGHHIMETPGGMQAVTVINESGVYELITTSRLPEAEAFKEWVFGKVVPKAVRQAGLIHEDQQGVVTREDLINTPHAVCELLLVILQERKLLDQQIEDYKPKVLFHDTVTALKGSVLLQDVANMLAQRGYPIGEIGLWQWCRQKKLCFKSNKVNRPYNKYYRMGIFEEVIQDGSDGKTYTTNYVTMKGIAYIIDKYAKDYEKKTPANATNRKRKS